MTKWELVKWHSLSRLSHCLPCKHTISDCWFQSQLFNFLSNFLFNVSGNAAKDSSYAWASATYMETKMEFLACGLGLIQPMAITAIWGVNPRILIFSLVRSPNSSLLPAFQTNISLFEKAVTVGTYVFVYFQKTFWKVKYFYCI